MRSILSFDVGIRNLAYCHIVSGTILDWGILDVHGKDLGEMAKAIVNTLDEKFAGIEFDQVLIENQPVMKNPTMKSVQMLIYSYFVVCREVGMTPIGDVRLIAASRKNKLCDAHLGQDPEGRTYKKNKDRAIATTRKLLVDQPTQWNNFFEAHKKRDDLADAFLQGRALDVAT